MLAFQYPFNLKKTTAVVESLSTTLTRCSVTDITSLLQDSTNRMEIYIKEGFLLYQVNLNVSGFKIPQISFSSALVMYVLTISSALG